MVGRVLFSLWFRLVVGFALVLALTLFGVSLYLNRVAASEADRLEQDIDEVRAARIEEVVSRYIQGRSRRVGLQGTLEHAGWLYGWRITVHDRDGTPLADSHVMVTRQATGPAVTKKSMPIMDEGQEVASLVMGEPARARWRGGADGVQDGRLGEPGARLYGNRRRRRRDSADHSRLRQDSGPGAQASQRGETARTRRPEPARPLSGDRTRSASWAVASTRWRRRWSEPSSSDVA